jgi:putative inorganic carbon (hco3(-)) transporter
MLVACGAAGAALVVDDRRVRTVAIALAMVVAPIVVLGSVWGEPRVVEFRDSPAQVALALLVGGAALAALVTAFRRWSSLFAIAAFAVLPLRVPIEIGGETANLLVPLYLVIGAGFITQASGEWRVATGDRAAGRRPQEADPWSRWLRRLLAATLTLYAIQAIYSEDVANAIENIGFFGVPFAVLFVLLAELEWSSALLRRVVLAVGAVATACSLVGLYQYFARDLFLNPELADANELHVYFRVNSIFFDPNIFARYLALAITALAACIAWGVPRRDFGLAVAVSAIGLVALAFSYSITGIAALLAGLGIVAILRWRWRGTIAFGALGVVGLVVLVIAGGTPTSDIEDYRSIDSGHADLIEGGLDLAADRPLGGWGSGSFGRAFYERIEPARTTVSHSEPITVAAEQGAIGFLLYAALVVTALVTVLGRGAGGSLARTAVGACFVAMLVSSFGYTGFVIDPALWALLALGVSLRARLPDRRSPDPSVGGRKAEEAGGTLVA